MKKIFTPLLIILLMVSCKENGVQLAKPSTFVRYFNGGFQDQAQAIIQTSDNGYLILANSGLVCSSPTICSDFRVKVIKTDAYGNQQWQSFFPSGLGNPKNYQGFCLAAMKDNSGEDSGYVIGGKEIYDTTINNVQTTATALLMIRLGIDSKGFLSDSTVKTYHTLPIQAAGLGVAVSPTNGFFVVGTNISDQTKDMFLTQINSNTLASQWLQTYGSGGDEVVHRLFLDEQNSFLYWAATRPNPYSGNSSMSLIKAAFNDANPQFQFYNPSNSVSYSLTATDVCTFKNNLFAMEGSYSLPSAPNSYSKIAFATADYTDTRVDSATYSIPTQTDTQPGNSICSTYDGGFLILGTIKSGATDTNYYLIKTDVHGKPLWSEGKQYGGQFPDTGVQVLQANDGGYIVLGTTILAGVSNVLLMKTDSQGDIQ